MTTIRAFSKAKNMVKLLENNVETWYWLTPQVQTFISTLQIGQEVEYTKEEKAGKNIVNFIKGIGNSPKVEIKSIKENKLKCEDCNTELKDGKYKVCFNCFEKRKDKVDSNFKPEIIKEPLDHSQKLVRKIFEFQCTECGAELKNDTYPTCYTCSMKLKASTNKSPEIQDSIKRQAIGHMTSRSLVSLQGEINSGNIFEISEKLYKHYQKLVG